jgi:drug/metabolite transporter (DMT)-like permease
MGLLNNVFPFLLITNGQQYITGGLASILNANTSFMTILIASLFIKNEKLLRSRLIGVTIGLIGVIITIGYENLSGIVSTEIGKFFIILSSVSYAFAAIFAKIKLNEVDPSLAATGMLTTSTIILTPIMFFYYSDEIYNLNFISIKYSIAFAIVCSVLAYLIYFKILSTTGPGNLLLCTIIIPPSAIILNAIFINEMIKIHEFIGMLIIIFGLLILDGRIFKKVNKISLFK